MPVMITFEYKSLVLQTAYIPDPDDPRGDRNAQSHIDELTSQLERVLNEYGRAGWELFSANVFNAGSIYTQIILKRERGTE
jgi:hypothetical protein